MTEPEIEGVVLEGETPTAIDTSDIDSLPVIPDEGDYNADWLRHLNDAGVQPVTVVPGDSTGSYPPSHAHTSPGVLNPAYIPPGTHQMLDATTAHTEERNWLDDGDLALDESHSA